MTMETFDFSKTSRWKLLALLTNAFIDRKLSLAWTPKPQPEPEVKAKESVKSDPIFE